MESSRLEYLFERYVSKTASEQEEQEFLELAEQPAYKTKLQSLLDVFIKETAPSNCPSAASDEAILQAIFQAEPKVVQMSTRRNYRWVAAAAVLILLVGGLWYINRDKTESNTVAIEPKVNDVSAPQVNRAMITLADGSTVYLDSAGSGELAMQGNTKLVKLADGRVVYQSASGSQQTTMVYNTLMNPRGSKVIDMQLADGSHVWLNAGSSVKYPVAFIGDERKVEITGEAYFEVAHDASKPFYVSKGDVNVQVLGTHFNVNAYDDEEAIKVTLLEGSVNVKRQTANVKLVPGQQAIANENGELKLEKSVDVDEVMAWKNGLFSFKSANIKAVMRQIARWYDVEVSYEGSVSNETISGDVVRNVNVSQVMKMLEFAGVHFKIDGRKVTVLP